MNLLNLQPFGAVGCDPLETAREWLGEYGRIALATVVSTWGSSPVPVGGQLVIAPGDRFQGSISGGCVEVDVITEAADVMASGRPMLLEFGVANDTAWRAGLPCGGNIKIFLQRLEGPSDVRLLDEILAARRARTTLMLLTDLSDGTRKISEDPSSLPVDFREYTQLGESCVVPTSAGETFLHVLKPPVRLIIAGATHIGQVLASLAQAIGYEVVVVDPRVAFASDERFAGTSAVTRWPAESMADVGLDRRTAVVALTHVANIDDEALTTALCSDCLYIGALGSRRTHEKRLDRLRETGFSDGMLSRIHAPVGLPIGAKGPAEIAVSILAEIIKTTRQPA